MDWNYELAPISERVFRIQMFDNDLLQKQLDAPIPWIGMYIAAASLVCTIAMAADVFNGIKTKKLWFPCIYFSLNATSLTLLAVAMKLPVDLSTSMFGVNDKLAAVSSLAMISIAISNFMMSVASMANNEILLNLTALGIFVITIAVNVLIHDVQGGILEGQIVLGEQLTIIVIMLILFVLICSLAIVVPTTKGIMEAKFKEMHETVANERTVCMKFTARELSTVLKKYWVMTVTGSPQFVMVRSVFSVTPGFMCLLLVFCLVEAHLRMYTSYWYSDQNDSTYKWSINWIMYIQTGGVAIGTVAPVSRWFFAVRFKSSWPRIKSFKEEMKVEYYWTERLVDWRERPVPLRIRHLKFKRVLHILKKLLLNVCIKSQVLIILANKLILIISERCMAASFMFLHHIYTLKVFASQSESGSDGGIDDFSHYTLLLEGEPELPVKTIADICNEFDKLILHGKLQKPKNLMKLLHKFHNFNGVAAFDSSEVAGLQVIEPRVCWSLSVVTLTSIAIALPNIPYYQTRQLLSGVSEGLSLVKLIEKTMDINGELTSVRDAADIVWVGLELYQKWQDKEIIRKMNKQDVTYKDAVLELSDAARKTVMDFNSSTNDSIKENPSKWPVKVISANSMYRLCQTLLLAENSGNECTTGQTGEQMFERITIMISDILAACFTNLAHVIGNKCNRNDIEKSQESIKHAAVLLGESEEIILFLEQQEWPSLDPDKAGYLEAWRVILEEDKEIPVSFVPENDYRPVQESQTTHVSIELGQL